jgi:DNA-binding NarL/FixJ family response regulator
MKTISKNNKITVGLVEDNLPMSQELEKWINDTKGLSCQSVYSNGETALKQLPQCPPQVLLVDLRLPGISGVELIRQLKVVCPDIQCLVLTMYSESDLIFDALKAGACGYLLKHTNPLEIADAIRQVHAGGSVMTPRIARKVLEMFSIPPTAKAIELDDYQLTEREKNVLQRMAEGQARKQIVDSLEINTHTLDYVIRCIYRKLHVNCVAAAVSIAMRDGILPGKK